MILMRCICDFRPGKDHSLCDTMKRDKRNRFRWQLITVCDSMLGKAGDPKRQICRE